MRLPILVLSSAALAAAFVTPWGNAFGDQKVLEDPVQTKTSWSFADCGEPNDVIQIESFIVSPDPPQPGKNLTVTVIAQANGVIADGAYADVTVKLGLVKLLNKRFDLCQEARNADTQVQCPVEPGPYTVVHTVALPKEIPPAKFTVAVRGYTVDEDPLMCANINADFRKKFPF